MLPSQRTHLRCIKIYTPVDIIYIWSTYIRIYTILQKTHGTQLTPHLIHLSKQLFFLYNLWLKLFPFHLTDGNGFFEVIWCWKVVLPCFICYSAVNHSNFPGSAGFGGGKVETGDIGSESCRLFLVVVLRWKLAETKKIRGFQKRLWDCWIVFVFCCCCCFFLWKSFLFG